MKILTSLIKTIISMVFITFCALVTIVILTIIMPDNMLKAIEIFRNLLC